MRAAWLLTLKDLRLRVRDRSAFLYGVVAPFVLAAVLGLVFDGADGPPDLTLGIAIEDSGDVGAGVRQGLLPGLRSGAGFDVVTVGGGSAARDAVEAGELDAAVVVPAGTSEALRGPADVRLEVVTAPDRPLAATVADAVADGLAAELTAARVLGTVGTLAGVPPTEVAAAIASGDRALAVVERPAEDRAVDPGTYLAAGMAVFFLFFTVQFGVTSLLDERRDGTLARLLSAPIGAAEVVGSKALTSFVLGLVSMAALVVATTVALGADWGSPTSVAVLVVAAVLSSVGIVTLLAAFARTPEQASTWQSIVAVVSGMLGGAFFPVADDGLLGLLSRVTPHRWFLDGLGDVAAGGGVATVVPAVGALAGFAVVTGGVGLVRLRRGLT